MPANVEIKAKLINRASVETKVAALSGASPEIIRQEDHFFKTHFETSGARLKLRVFSEDSGELIRYKRSNTKGTRHSEYSIARTSTPETLREILTATLGSAGIVRKTRTLYLIGLTRVHLDGVEGLGDFLELEMVLRPDQDEAEGKRIAEALLRDLGIGEDQLIGEAYVDLLARA